MTEKDRQAFVETLTGLVEIFGREPLSKIGLKLYWESLKDLALDEFKAGANRIARENKFFPRPSEIRELSKGNRKEASLRAWITVTGAAGRHDYYTTVSFEDRAINAALCAGWGDWAKFCDDLNARNKEWVQKDFERYYDLYFGKDVSAVPDKVLGWHDKHNIGEGYKGQKPALIGGEQKKAIEDRTRVQVEEGK